ncbi:MAG TPA: hypothetical protein PLV52_00245 [Candidatus Omnitrophota bacterium]|nr:hypothetical protein [Candidatus Omnitrophota bacterium]
MPVNLIHSALIPDEYIKGLENLFPGLSRYPLPVSKDVYDSISSHPDIFIFTLHPVPPYGGTGRIPRPPQAGSHDKRNSEAKDATTVSPRSFTLDQRTFVLSGQVPTDLAQALTKSGARVIKSLSSPRGKYPDTSPLNAVRVGRFLIHNTDHTDQAIKALCVENGLEFVHVGQGYARCSVVPVGANAIITCDPGIFKAVSSAGLAVKLISGGNIRLPGERYGFIGGASGVLPGGRLVFLGDITRHPDYGAMSAFMYEHGVEYLHIKGLDLFDAGSLIFF